MNTLSDYLRDGYVIVSSHGGAMNGHFLVLQKELSVVVAKLPSHPLSGNPADTDGYGVKFVEVSS